MVDGQLGINHQSPLIHFEAVKVVRSVAGNQSPIPFDTLQMTAGGRKISWESITNPL